jgi:rSAM/selenodomain-associated transferase 1
MSQAAVAVFARLPRRGEVKTRLAASIGEDSALALHTACLASTASLITSLPEEVHKRLYLTGTQDEAQETARALGLPTTVTVHTQRGETLGERLNHALLEILSDKVERIVFIGSDSPTLSPEILLHALDLLEKHDAVIGPAQDGGYYLIGTRGFWPEMFREISWGTEHALRQTLDNLQRAGRRVAKLPEGYDVDRLEDLERLTQDIRREQAQHLEPLLGWIQTQKT